MKNVIVTGGTGMVGSNLAIALVKRGCNVRILRRENSNLRAIGNAQVEHCIGDVLNPDTLRKAIKGCDTVFHVAGYISYWKPERDIMMRTNVEGTRNIVSACLEMNIPKLIQTSSIAAIGFPSSGNIADETCEFDQFNLDIGYRISKHLAEVEVLRGIKAGLDAVMVNPAVIIGERDLHFNSGKVILDMTRKKFYPYPPGGVNIVNVADVVQGHILAAERGKAGERYILGGENLTFQDFLKKICFVIQKNVSLIPAPSFMIPIVAYASEQIAYLTGKKPFVTREFSKGAENLRYFSIEKAKRELGYAPAPITDGIRATIDWYREQKFI